VFASLPFLIKAVRLVDDMTRNTTDETGYPLISGFITISQPPDRWTKNQVNKPVFESGNTGSYNFRWWRKDSPVA
jgi:hypothetical protein